VRRPREDAAGRTAAPRAHGLCLAHTHTLRPLPRCLSSITRVFTAKRCPHPSLRHPSHLLPSRSFGLRARPTRESWSGALMAPRCCHSSLPRHIATPCFTACTRLLSVFPRCYRLHVLFECSFRAMRRGRLHSASLATVLAKPSDWLGCLSRCAQDPPRGRGGDDGV
jgi:hypothetical protein